MKTPYIFSAILFFCFAGCNKKDDISKTDCSAISATYSGDISPLVSSHCLNSGCHNTGSSNGDFATYNGLKVKADNGTLNNAVVVNKTMPKTGSLTTDERKKFKCWIDAGAPKN